MFYEVMGPLLTRAATKLMEQIGPEIEDEFMFSELEAIALFLGELGAMWPKLFAAMQAEQKIYTEALAIEQAPDEDPLHQMRTLSEDIARQLAELVGASDEDSLKRKARLREALLRGADIQKEMLARARTSSPVQPRRRV